MLGDQAGLDNLVGEGVVDHVGLAAGPRFPVVDGTDCQVAAAQDCRSPIVQA